MSGDVVARAKAALEGVRPAPWQVVGYGNLHAGEPGEHPPLGKVYGTANAAFVAASRSLVPELLAEVERLRKLLGWPFDGTELQATAGLFGALGEDTNR